MNMDFIRNNKSHITYILLIVGVIVIGYNLLSRKPKEIIKTEFKEKIVYRDVVKEKNVYVDRTTTVTKANGDVIVTTDKTRSNERVDDKQRISDITVNTEVQKFLSRYSVDAMFPFDVGSILNPALDPRNIQVMGGIRMGDLPLFLTVGTDGHFNKAIVGLRIEF
jgi:hypothetical protein